MGTHEVTNQPPPLVDYNLAQSDVALMEALGREGAGWALEEVWGLGALAGTADVVALGFSANASPPLLRTHDRYGHRIDQVEYHPAYHELMGLAMAEGLSAQAWRRSRPGAHVARAAKFMVWSQVDAGHTCPVSMTYASIPVLRNEPALAASWEPKLTSPCYDSRFRPLNEKLGATCGMAMTEKQGGSDVRANATRARCAAGADRGGPGSEYLLTGHKWFCSAPMSDAFLVLAQAPGGLSCFLVARWLPDGTRNVFSLQRLKDKLGNRSNASSEVEFDDTVGWMVGEEGRGVPTIIEMVNHTRLDCVLAAAAGMRQAVVQAIHHARFRSAFGRSLLDQPLMANVLGDLALESEAATAVALRLARAYDVAAARAKGPAHAEAAGTNGALDPEMAFARIATAVAKYWVCKRQPVHAAEALECLGGNGYVEESIMPRLFRESPLNGIWEGSGNVICLDVLRVVTRDPQSLEAFVDEVSAAAGADARFDASLVALRQQLGSLTATSADGRGEAEWGSRRLVERMALVLQASLLIRHAPPLVADAFCASRLGNDWGRALGTLPFGAAAKATIERAYPPLA